MIDWLHKLMFALFTAGGIRLRQGIVWGAVESRRVHESRRTDRVAAIGPRSVVLVFTVAGYARRAGVPGLRG